MGEITEKEKEEMIEDLRRTGEEIDGNLTVNKHKEKGDFCPYRIKYAFGTWNKAKEEAGLETTKRKLEDQEIIKDLKRVAEELGKNTITVKEYNKHGEHNSSTLQTKFGGWNNACKKAGCSGAHRSKTYKEEKKRILKEIDEEIPGRVRQKHLDNKNVRYLFNNIRLRELRQELGLTTLEDDYRKAIRYIENNDVTGYVKVDELIKEIEENTGRDIFHNKRLQKFIDFANENSDLKFSLNTSGGSSRSIYIDDGRYNSEDKFSRAMRKKYNGLVEEAEVDDPEIFEEFLQAVGYGMSPSGAFAGLLYLETDFTQRKIGDRVGVTEVTVRNCYKKIQKQTEGVNR